MPMVQEYIDAPVTLRERLEHIDILRGIALLGVLVMNLHFFFRDSIGRYRLESHPWGGWWNIGTDWALLTLVEGKAMTIFAMLFAVGLAIQVERATERGSGFWGFGFRRLGALFLFGLLHFLLIWNGDILHNYALVGMLALGFLKRNLKTILIWLGSLYGLVIVGVLIVCIRQAMGAAPSPRSAADIAQTQAWLQETLQVRGSGTWVAEFWFRLREFARVQGLGGELTSMVDIFLKFMLGLAIWKSGILRNPSAHLPKIRKFFIASVSAGLACAIIVTLWGETREWTLVHWRHVRYLLPIIGLSQSFRMTLLGMGWAAGVILLLQRATWKKLLEPFKAVGRMAFTNYLAQSLVMTFLFNGWGLGLYHKLSPLEGVGVSVVFFTLQALFSRWWLTRYQFGPAEWAWRSLTYWKRQPFKMALPLAATPANSGGMSDTVAPRNQ
jgi:uncharacterized protein